jgi:predicted RNA binding protein YcfA (HicA-like mRNA interferase family)
MPSVAKRDKRLARVLSGASDANVRFDDLRGLLLSLGFEERVRGSHHLFVRPGVEELVNLQREGKNAKPYQVRQVRSVIVRYGLGGELDV